MRCAGSKSVVMHVHEQILEAVAFKNRIVGSKESGADALPWSTSTK